MTIGDAINRANAAEAYGLELAVLAPAVAGTDHYGLGLTLGIASFEFWTAHEVDLLLHTLSRRQVTGDRIEYGHTSIAEDGTDGSL